ncbi:hypothetical protein CI109_103611 [Kwoniella shandongensis]|uniref:RecQ-mediated genome instability protein 1 n=1 Tax=Kwoniella shandongensis TaxID=1734106 RepID=A0A5M6CCG9_9TREE|nr:uncharacterized protein CI109_000697 [Kwoniella shandongensis]KAA5531125.1 hypothetical protein CI109_000697 [Kwoniella shandongensis]
MTDIARFLAFLKRTYPLPEVDPTWVREIVQALTEAGGGEVSVDDVHTQYLHSDLSFSTLESRSFPPGELHNRILFPRPTLLQIHAISEIGSSAFQIQTVMEQRSEVLSGASRIRRLDDDENEEEEEDGKVPPYPRGMLRLEVGDGRRVMRAMEYKRIGELVLGQTSLGCKLLVQNVRCLGDILLLTPQNTQVIESSVEHLEALQRLQFINDLKRRMGKPEQIEDVALPSLPQPPAPRAQAQAVEHIQPEKPRLVTQAAQPQAQLSEAAKARRRALMLEAMSAPPPPPYQNQVDVPQSSRQAQAQARQALSSSPPPVVRPIARRHRSVKPASSTWKSEETLGTPRKSTRAAGQQASARVKRLYQTIPDIELDPNVDIDVDEEDLFDDDIDESFMRHYEEVEAEATKPRQTNGYETDEEDAWALDESAIDLLERAESGVADGVHSNRNTSKKRYHDPDDDYDEEVEDLDDSIQIIDAASFSQVKSKTASTSIRSSGQSTRSRPSQRKKYEGDDSQKENRFPDIVVVSD